MSAQRAVLQLFGRLDDDAVRLVLKFVRRDRLGNETVPSLLFETRVWRRVCARFLALSRDTPSAYDASRIVLTRDGRFPSAFAGGRRCSPPAGLGTHQRAVYNWKAAPTIETQPPQLFVLREPHTGRIWPVCTGWRATPEYAPDSVLFVQAVLKIKHLVQLVSGQNADFDTRLDYFDRLVAGLHVQVPKDAYDSQHQSLTALHMVKEAPPHLMVPKAYDCKLYWHSFLVGGPKMQLKPKLLLDLRRAHVELLSDDRGDLRNDDAVAPHLPALSILFGYYDHPTVAECDGMQVSLHKHGLPKELLPRPKANDPERHLRIVGRAALDRAERIAAERTAIVVRPNGSVVVAAGPSGPSATPARRPRSAAVDARDGIREGVQADNDTLSTGRLKMAVQMGDHESREAEADGYVDDQYAGFGEERDEPVLYDSDGEYDDAAGPRSKRTMAAERRAEAVADDVRRIREMMVPSDSEDDSDDAMDESDDAEDDDEADAMDD